MAGKIVTDVSLLMGACFNVQFVDVLISVARLN